MHSQNAAKSLREFDCILVGGGLQNGLLALAMLQRRPDLRLALIERDEMLGGNHTWSFHARDVPEDVRAWLETLIVHRWPRYEVRFPNLRRVIEGEYATITSARLDSVVRERMSSAPETLLVTGVVAEHVGAYEVTLADGRRFRAPWIVDARGPGPAVDTPSCGYQKFVGLEVELEHFCDLEHPLLMDATVPQHDGFRFAHVLPLAPNRVLVQDTYFSNDSSLDQQEVRRLALRHLVGHGMVPRQVMREESGVLPMPWHAAPVERGPSPLRAGFQGGWFHPATGDSFACALRLARFVASRAPTPPFGPELEAIAMAHDDQARFARRLNWLLFLCVPSSARWRLFARFHRLPDDTIRRFHALETDAVDRVRILFGWPPARFSRARRLAPRRSR